MRQILLFIFIGVANLYGQETINVNFNEATPVWIHTMEDTTFVPVAGQPYYTKYSSLRPHLIYREGNYLYTMATCLEKNTLDDYGFILNKLDINTGQIAWSHHNTPYNDGHKDIYHTLQIDEDKIEMVGAVELDRSKHYASHKTIDAQSGEIIKYNQSNTQLPGFYMRYFTGYVLSSDSLLLNAYTNGNEDSIMGVLRYSYGLDAEVYDKNMTKLVTTRGLFDFDSLEEYSIDQPNYTLRLNQTSLISLAYKDRYESWDNLGTKIMWTDISDPSNIKAKLIKDYSDIVPGTKSNFLLQSFNVVNNTIHLSHSYPNLRIQKNTCYILWLDSIGGIKTFVPITKTGDHVYGFADMIYANNDFAYLFAFPSKTGHKGFDIIRVESGLDSIKFVSSITSQNNDEEFGTQINGLYEDGYIVFGGYTNKQGQGTKTSVKVYCFKASDLGINFEPVSTISNDYGISNYSIFPNPSTNTLYLKLSNIHANAQLEIYDLNGKLILFDALRENFNQIDIGHLQPGVYFAKVINLGGEQIGKINKIIKVE